MIKHEIKNYNSVPVDGFDAEKPFIVVGNCEDQKPQSLKLMNNSHFFTVDFSDADQLDEVFDSISEIAYTYRFNHDKINVGVLN